jgi:CBS domain-containing protein
MTDALVPNITHFLNNVDPFNKMPEPLVRQVASTVKITYVGKGETLDPCLNSASTQPVETRELEKQDKYLYVIRSGAMEQREADGVLRARLGAEDVFGFTFLDSSVSEQKGYKAIALENTLLYLIPHKALTSIFKDSPEFAEHFAAQAQTRLKSALDVVWSNKEKGLFIRTVSEVASKAIAIVDAKMSIQEVAKEMRYKKRTSTAVVCDDGQLIGIITDRDMTKRVIADGYDLTAPIKSVMTANPMTVSPHDLVLHAASLMMQHNIRSLPVVEDGKVVGLLTTSHLVQNHRMQAIFLIEKIKYAESVEDLEALNTERQAIFEALIEGQVPPDITGRVMAMMMDAYNRRLIQLAISHFGEPPCKFSWIVAGSHARNEVHMLSDQDSALVLSDDATENDKVYFRQLSQYVVKGLDACGYPLCPGNYMAATPKWCQPQSVWREYYRKWVSNPEYERLLNISVFLEIRSVYGEASYADELRDELHSQIKSNREFLGILTRDAINTQPPLGVFKNLVLEKTGENKKTLNIKKYAINLIIDLARIYGLAVECDSSNTKERFTRANEQGILSDDAYKNILNTYQYVLMFRQHHQLEALKQGGQPDSHINPDTFGSFERGNLKDAFLIISGLQDAAKLRFAGRM